MPSSHTFLFAALTLPSAAAAAGEVAVYVTAEGSEPNKPPVGSGLNCPCKVTLTGVLRKPKPGQSAAAVAAAFRKRLARYCSEMGARFIDYKPDGGIWTFEVVVV
jgi:nuclear pore complex protein Nup98-Nup96